jgi:glycosyltransferase involved in cell wall biosynthesis
MASCATAPPVPAPLVSIIVPSFNQGRFIRQTIESALAQSYRPLEIVVVDGGSSDETLQVLRSFGERPELRWRSEPDDGVAHAVNKGLALAAGSIAGIQSSDDYYLPGALEAAVAAFSDPSVGLVYGDVQKVDEAGVEVLRTRLPGFSLERFLAKMTWIPQPAAFFRVALARALGGWDSRYFVADTEFWLRMAFRAQVAKVDRVLGARREHAAQRDKQLQAIRESYARMVAESLELRAAPWRLRRAAACGRHLHALRYGAARTEWSRAWRLWRAVLAYPPVLSALPSWAGLLPGYFRLREQARQALGR